ncbi:ArsR/SmtB family transcription factor [Neolewinella persica]|uniref:ArsR/SmtB family transcription factor n=1 Tax=Neolewinella persica TaxID=70998 RepID=UPI0003748311|nr:metalloregulator ArsR/SmtB family transcription factor [Neolewinella persica]
MGLTKTDAYTPDQIRIAELCKAIGHPARVAILQKLLTVECCISRDFSDEIDLSQPTISRHLQELKTVGLIAGTIEGTSVSYCINPERWREVQGFINGLFELYGKENNCC